MKASLIHVATIQLGSYAYFGEPGRTAGTDGFGSTAKIPVIPGVYTAFAVEFDHPESDAEMIGFTSSPATIIPEINALVDQAIQDKLTPWTNPLTKQLKTRSRNVRWEHNRRHSTIGTDYACISLCAQDWKNYKDYSVKYEPIFHGQVTDGPNQGIYFFTGGDFSCEPILELPNGHGFVSIFGLDIHSYKEMAQLKLPSKLKQAALPSERFISVPKLAQD